MTELTPVGMAVLALLNERPMHAYEMFQVLMSREEDRLIKVRLGTVYHTVERLAGQQLVEATGTERAGNRPERTTYAITAEGSAALRRRISEAIETPVYEYPLFPVALSEAHNLPADETVRVLNRRLELLRKQVDEIEATIERVRTEDVEEAYWFVADYLRTQAVAERDWLQTIVNRIESKDLPWPYRSKKS
ncbi:DNA-binding PadR family transcriptional regulator [Kribbella orskensis]|uniref:DNA-binding PadR family transcriptional regulator n=1 Tax=Kribbella orskensis TaxID=2512216 RepID=A0ABY2BKS8_9ACTN|nr:MULTISPECIES: PadR family transcriptional regulator [Kribbella]TCN40296.1 DNA-binding PadR family transcriptional regulator [Kribbella sp. VKM Ac-2500]TCO22916.1 DNA-binding PadR family transcriptional regulator [Kribbella orskensis]